MEESMILRLAGAAAPMLVVAGPAGVRRRHRSWRAHGEARSRKMTMLRRALGVAALSLLAAGPVLAAEAGCQDQIDAVKAMLSAHPEAAAEASLRVKVNEAQRLCSADKDRESQDLAGQIREQVGQATAGQGISGGDTSPRTPSAPAPDR